MDERRPRREGARVVAARVLLRVAEDASWATAALDAELERARLAERDAALATQIVYGALRVLPALDQVIDAELTHASQRVDPLARAALRAATFQLLHLARVPAHAIVDETVGWVRVARGAGLAAFVNAVLRKLASKRPAEPALPTGLSVPPWIERVIEESLGAERSRALLVGGRDAPPLGLRVRAGIDREALAQKIREARPRASIEAGALAPHALVLRRAGDPRTLVGWREGEFSVQEEGSQLVAAAVGAQPGERVADVCAGHGGKAAYLLECVGVRGHVTALDRDARKLARIGEELARLGLGAAHHDVRAADLAAPIEGLAADYDRVLVDAPCSGLGTLARRPEIMLRLEPTDLDRLARTQQAIALHAAALVRPGGTLVYAVCSPARAEGVAVVQALESALPRLERIQASEPGCPPPDADGVLRIGPWLGIGTASEPDAYQVVRWRVR